MGRGRKSAGFRQTLVSNMCILDGWLIQEKNGFVKAWRMNGPDFFIVTWMCGGDGSVRAGLS